MAEEAEKAAAESKRSKGADSDELRFQDSTYVELALRVLGLMCDGQNRTLQVRCMPLHDIHRSIIVWVIGG